jgi:hypothetical protein
MPAIATFLPYSTFLTPIFADLLLQEPSGTLTFLQPHLAGLETLTFEFEDRGPRDCQVVSALRIHATWFLRSTSQHSRPTSDVAPCSS